MRLKHVGVPRPLERSSVPKLEVDGRMVYFKEKGIYYIGNGAYQSTQGRYMATTANQIWWFHWENNGQEDPMLD